VKWVFKYLPESATKGTVIIKAEMEKDWHIYSVHQTGDGPIATSIVFDKSDEFELLGELIEPEPKSIFSEVFAMDVKSFSDQVEFHQKIQLNSSKTSKIYGQLEFMACTEFSCLPPKTIMFEVDLSK
jgi:thiol:disulfide interchange protein DsbD